MNVRRRNFSRSPLEQGRHFSPFVVPVSADGLRGKEAKLLLKNLSAWLAEKWEKPFSEVCGYVNARMSIAIVKAVHLCLHGSRIPTSKICSSRPPEPGRILGRFKLKTKLVQTEGKVMQITPVDRTLIDSSMAKGPSHAHTPREPWYFSGI